MNLAVVERRAFFIKQHRLPELVASAAKNNGNLERLLFDGPEAELT